jgi:hypothetical protein
VRVPSQVFLPPELGVQAWLESCAQGYLAGTRNGRPGGDIDPSSNFIENEVLRSETIRYTVQILVAERCSLAATAGLINATPWESCKRYLATQVLDEARHVEIFTNRLYELGVEQADLEAIILQHAHPDLLGLSEIVLAEVRAGDLLAGLVGQGIVLDEFLVTIYEMLAASVAVLDPSFSLAIEGILHDERRHTDVAEQMIRELLARHPEKKVELGRLQRELVSLVIRTLDDAFRENPLPAEFRRVAAELGGGAKIDWAGIDLLSADTVEIEQAVIRQVKERLRTRFQRVGMGSYTPPLA